MFLSPCNLNSFRRTEIGSYTLCVINCIILILLYCMYCKHFLSVHYNCIILNPPKQPTLLYILYMYVTVILYIRCFSYKYVEQNSRYLIIFKMHIITVLPKKLKYIFPVFLFILDRVKKFEYWLLHCLGSARLVNTTHSGQLQGAL